MAASYVIDFTVGWSFGEPQLEVLVDELYGEQRKSVRLD